MGDRAVNCGQSKAWPTRPQVTASRVWIETERVPFPAGTPPADKAHYPVPQCQQSYELEGLQVWTHSEAAAIIIPRNARMAEQLCLRDLTGANQKFGNQCAQERV